MPKNLGANKIDIVPFYQFYQTIADIEDPGTQTIVSRIFFVVNVIFLVATFVLIAPFK